MHLPLHFYGSFAAFYRATILGNAQHGYTSVAYKIQPRNIYFFFFSEVFLPSLETILIAEENF